MYNVIDKIRELFGQAPKQRPNPYMVLNTSTGMTAKSAYMRAKYGMDTTQTSLLKKFFNDVNDLIAAKSLDGSYCCMIEIDKDIKQFIPEIIDRFQNKLGYTLVVIDKDTVITNKVTGDNKQLDIASDSAFIILMWSTAYISDIQTSDTIEEN
jgi:hypothetical protein